MTKTVTFRVTEEEHQFLEEFASKNGMSKSEYVKARLFEDNINKAEINLRNLSDFEKDLISTSKKACNLVYLIAENLVSKEQADTVVEKAEELLIKKGYRRNDNKVN